MSVETRIMARDIISGALATLWLIGSGPDDVEALVDDGPLRRRMAALDDAQREQLRKLVGGVWSSGVLKLVPQMTAVHMQDEIRDIAGKLTQPARVGRLEGAVLVVDSVELARLLTGDPERRHCELVVAAGNFHALTLKAVH